VHKLFAALVHIAATTIKTKRKQDKGKTGKMKE
jgi:hypothetical protein